ncbi:extracellular tyrosine-protein kinase PKDCC-like [Amphiura filiformis]|uniref:extracellular tyrosine-protein kinase PKDCC-like n=1 Tax=Amphiura filiformis TaxID=82378 RepID=UPI003B2193D0
MFPLHMFVIQVVIFWAIFKTAESQGCVEIANLPLQHRLGRGSTKDVFASVYKDIPVAVKMVSPEVRDIRSCLKKKKFRDPEECFMYANFKLMKEIALFQQLEHPNIAKLVGYCVQSEPLYNRKRDHGVISVVEFGSEFGSNVHQITVMSWLHRLQVTTGLADLLEYLEHSPLGSLAIWDYKHRQFILTSDNTVKLNDLDDLSADEPQCETQEDCIISKSKRISVLCTHSRCDGFNAKYNLLRTTELFFTPLLKNPPKKDKKELREMFVKLSNLQINATDVKVMLTEIYNKHVDDEGRLGL